MAIEIVDLPINSMVVFHSFLYVYNGVISYHICHQLITQFNTHSSDRPNISATSPLPAQLCLRTKRTSSTCRLTCCRRRSGTIYSDFTAKYEKTIAMQFPKISQIKDLHKDWDTYYYLPYTYDPTYLSCRQLRMDWYLICDK